MVKIGIIGGSGLDDPEIMTDPNVVEVETNAGSFRGRNVVLALGRRGTPRKLGVPGEDKTKVAYSLIDAESYQNSHILVVGGGDSAIEAAIGLSKQEGNTVTLSYRKHAFFRIKARNEENIDIAIANKEVEVVFESHVLEILDDSVRIAIGGKDDPDSVTEMPNDAVFVFAGGIAPFSMLQDAGVSLDPQDRPEVAPLTEEGTGLVRALALLLPLQAAGEHPDLVAARGQPVRRGSRVALRAPAAFRWPGMGDHQDPHAFPSCSMRSA